MLVLNKLRKYIVDSGKTINDDLHETYCFINDIQYLLSVSINYYELTIVIESSDCYIIIFNKTFHDEYPLYNICIKYMSRNQTKLYLLLEPSIAYRYNYYLTFTDCIKPKNIKLVKLDCIDQETIGEYYNRWITIFESIN